MSYFQDLAEARGVVVNKDFKFPSSTPPGAPVVVTPLDTFLETLQKEVGALREEFERRDQISKAKKELKKYVLHTIRPSQYLPDEVTVFRNVIRPYEYRQHTGNNYTIDHIYDVIVSDHRRVCVAHYNTLADFVLSNTNAQHSAANYRELDPPRKKLTLDQIKELNSEGFFMMGSPQVVDDELDIKEFRDWFTYL